MHTLRLALLLCHSLALVEASVKWTLHSSCYRSKDGQQDDRDLEKAMIGALESAKAWADRGADRLTKSKVPFFGNLVGVRDNIKPLMSHGKFEDNVDAVVAKFKLFNDLEGPIGKGDRGTDRYDHSDDWTKLASSDEHYLDFLLVCRPELEDRAVESMPGRYPYDLIRRIQKYTNDLKDFVTQEDSVGDWAKIDGTRTQAITSVDTQKPTGGRLKVPETITFHPLWIKRQRERNFNGWTDDLFAQVTAKDAPKVFEEKGKAAKNDNVKPADALFDASFVRNIFHEFFHLTAFGGMIDDMTGAYGWYNNVQSQAHDNPDYFAIVAATIELLERDGKQYKIKEDGSVSRKRI